MLRFLTKKYIIPDNISVNGFNGSSYSTINTGKITSIDLVRNNFEFAVGESPLIIIKHPNFDTGGNEQKGKNRFLTLSIYKHSRGYIEMERDDSTDANIPEIICTSPNIFYADNYTNTTVLTKATSYSLVYVNTLVEDGFSYVSTPPQTWWNICHNHQ